MSIPRVVYPFIVLCAAASMGADSCSTTTTDQPDSGTKAAPDTTTTTHHRHHRHRVARIGDAITLKGTDTQLRVRVLRVLDPVSAGEYDEAPAGSRYVGVQVSLENTGDTTYADSPGNGATIITNTDEQADSRVITGGPCSAEFASGTKIAPGARRVGCIPFEVRASQRPKTFQFALDSGFGPQNGEWRLR